MFDKQYGCQFFHYLEFINLTRIGSFNVTVVR
jgi:hypothetical protein